MTYNKDPRVLTTDQSDLPKILELQYLAYQSEAALFDDYNIQPLTETLEELEEEYRRGLVLKMVTEDGKIIGSVRSYSADGTTYIGKLMVHPDFQHRGLGTLLIHKIEEASSDARYELFTSTRSVNNIRLYERLGYKKFKEEHATDEIVFVYLEKSAST